MREEEEQRQHPAGPESHEAGEEAQGHKEASALLHLPDDDASHAPLTELQSPVPFASNPLAPLAHEHQASAAPSHHNKGGSKRPRGGHHAKEPQLSPEEREYEVALARLETFLRRRRKCLDDFMPDRPALKLPGATPGRQQAAWRPPSMMPPRGLEGGVVGADGCG